MPTRVISTSMVRRCLAFAFVWACGLAIVSVANACPQCQKALANSEGGLGGNIVRGYFWSILFMLSMPFLVLGGLSSYFYLLVRKARRQTLSPTIAVSRQPMLPPAELPMEYDRHPQPAAI